MLDPALDQALNRATESPRTLDLLRAILVQIRQDTRLGGREGEAFLPAARDYRELLALDPESELDRERLIRFESGMEDASERLTLHERAAFERLVRLVSRGPFGDPIPDFVVDFAWRRFEAAKARAASRPDAR